ncbi:MAG: gfo/Idh/MocA family oxidoreductase, partial [Bryobacterales bacterium]|nr:gfo/Idh/MocA family oxidoreductase [Bryobacterales bacterium]
MDISRRGFLHAGAVAGLTPEARGVAANDRIQVGVIGAGARSHELMQALMAHPGAEIVAVADAYKGRVERALERVGG